MKTYKLYLQKDNPKLDKTEKFSIYTRRYLGNKTNFIPLINRVLKENKISFQTMMEPCMGTGVLSFYFASLGKEVIASDLLPLNFVIGKAFMESFEKVDLLKIAALIKRINSLKGKKGILTKKYKDKFVSLEVIKKADQAINFLRTAKSLSLSEKYYLASSLVLALEKASNIDSDYLGLEKIDIIPTFQLVLKKLEILKSRNAQVFNIDALRLVKQKKADLTIFDPPFSVSDYRDYMNFPEFIIEKIFPNFKKPKRSLFCNKTKYLSAFQAFINQIKGRFLIFFYSNDGLARREFLISCLKKKFSYLRVYDVIRLKNLHLVRDEPKTDYLILAEK